MSVVSLKNLDQLQSIALLVILVKTSRKENKTYELSRVSEAIKESLQGIVLLAL